MWLKLRFTNKSGRSFRLTKDVTVKEAKQIFNKEYKNDDNIVKVWLTHFDGWRDHRYLTLKDKK